MTMLPILNCDNCGACCMLQESPPGYLNILVYGKEHAFTDDNLTRFKAMPPELMNELKSYLEGLRKYAAHPNGGACIWFDRATRKCKHYELRPDICRTYVEIGDKACISWRKEFQDMITPNT